MIKNLCVHTDIVNRRINTFVGVKRQIFTGEFQMIDVDTHPSRR